jgi:Rieske Fe-S protein
VSIESVSRRSAISGAVITVGAGILGYAVARNSSAAEKKRSTTAANAYGYGGGGSSKTRLAALSAVPVGGGVVLSKKDVVLTRDQSGAVHAFSATCTHQGCMVTDVAHGQIICPCHGSRFNAETGAPVAGPAPRPLPSVSVTVDGDAIFTS